jgi:RimJ/RimL family protein N-acetyltransferase
MPLDPQTASFVRMHRPALEAAPVRHNLLIALLDRAARRDDGDGPPLAAWSLGGPGACALRLGDNNIVLGDLDRDQCAALAGITADLDYPGVIGPDRTADWFVDAAVAHGLRFGEPIPQRIYALSGPPRYPDAPGAARPVTPDDADRLGAWFVAFVAEALPHETPPARAEIEAMAGSGQAFFWEVAGEPVSMALIMRETATTAAISFVYTPPAERGRGYAGAATAAVAEEVFRRGKAQACLYTDLRNPISNRCYLGIGFEPVCDSAFWPRNSR